MSSRRREENLAQRAMIQERQANKRWEGREWVRKLINEPGFPLLYESTTGKRWCKSWLNDPYRAEQKLTDLHRFLTASRKERLRIVRDELLNKNVSSSMRHYLAVIRATPEWANMDRIKYIYQTRDRIKKKRPELESLHVDHIIPLRGKIVSGLHVEENLRIVRGCENVTKNNKFTEDMLDIPGFYATIGVK